MHLPVLSVVGYVATLVIAVAAAAVHPWLDVEAHFVRAVSGLSTAAATLTSNVTP